MRWISAFLSVGGENKHAKLLNRQTDHRHTHGLRGNGLRQQPPFCLTETLATLSLVDIAAEI